MMKWVLRGLAVGISAALLLMAAVKFARADARLPEACARVAASYGVAVPRTLSLLGVRAALVKLKLADQSNPDVRLCRAQLQSEIKK